MKHPQGSHVRLQGTDSNGYVPCDHGLVTRPHLVDHVLVDGRSKRLASDDVCVD